MALQTMESYPLTEAKDKFSALTAKANATGVPFRCSRVENRGWW